MQPTLPNKEDKKDTMTITIKNQDITISKPGTKTNTDSIMTNIKQATTQKSLKCPKN